MKKTVLITGASQGFGKLIAKKFQKEGWNVIATMRTPEKETELTQLENVLVNRLDVTNQESITKAVAEGIEQFGKIDVLVNNAGFGLQGPFMDSSEAMIRKQMDVNVYGVLNVTKAVLPNLEKEGGTIINFSSIAGLVGLPHTSVYNATKYAVEGFTEGLQYELNPLGIKLKLIQPGAFNTGFVAAMDRPDVSEESAYKSGWEATVAQIESMLSAGQDPQEVADITFLAATDGEERLRYLVGNDAQQMMEGRKQMNDVEFKSMLMESFNL
ncbi:MULTISPECIES: SDR family oxidoreductase [unclassified Tenacibaculum]|uniref:SDR family oxidoreductase n=1 Tax=unclassified Tenacibaculum TaxID=2635139 RepID=UPI001F4252A6|nr:MULTISPECIES: SDR family oxidoreductase [unclassified Tenacibaculum]MCF2875561.1 SDR family oxidoreductase [Tenacibaculum sp. Cn5-1]MCF2935637.1 SDR family oxidoreductase [Tenacibaculum sp. Cn5-34]MCG7512197.1 SDR family oxidoreductase [Tenacibaculum sp. Cn5-46]